MIKVLTIVGTRPEIIRLSRIIPLLDKKCTHILAHTGQNFSKQLSDIFFEELAIRKPDYHFSKPSSSFGEQLGNIFRNIEEVIEKEKPDKVLILGDTNSGLSAIIAKRMGVKVYHMEAGNRCFDDNVPEEVNRRIIDHASDVLLPYTKGSKAHLLKEGIDGKRIIVSGNPIFEVIEHYRPKINKSHALKDFGLEKKKYFLVTAHRAENVDNKDRLAKIVRALEDIESAYEMPVIVSTHPHTRDRLEKFGIKSKVENIIFTEPVGFFDFIKLEENALCVLTDSGTVQEESCILHVPSVILRDVTERMETLEAGSGILAGSNPQNIIDSVAKVLKAKTNWLLPEDYEAPNLSSKIAEILLRQ